MTWRDDTRDDHHYGSGGHRRSDWRRYGAYDRDHHRHGRPAATLWRFRRYLATRRPESWLFFAAGFVLAAVLT